MLFVDPLGFDAGDSNLYRYATNNLAQLTDPSGLASVRGGNLTVDIQRAKTIYAMIEGKKVAFANESAAVEISYSRANLKDRDFKVYQRMQLEVTGIYQYRTRNDCIETPYQLRPGIRLEPKGGQHKDHIHISANKYNPSLQPDNVGNPYRRVDNNTIRWSDSPNMAEAVWPVAKGKLPANISETYQGRRVIMDLVSVEVVQRFVDFVFVDQKHVWTVHWTSTVYRGVPVVPAAINLGTPLLPARLAIVGSYPSFWPGAKDVRRIILGDVDEPED